MLVVSACAQLPQSPTPPVRTETKVAEFGLQVSTKCLAKKDVPPVPVKVDVDPETATTKQLVAAETADVLTQDRYILLADKTLQQCSN